MSNCSIPYADLKGARVVLGLSGGVDSSVSAALLQEQGLKVTALFMKNWEEDDTDSYCAAAQDREDAQKVCDKLGIELLTINFAAEYWDRVFENFLSEYAAGRTPNPDILCNKEIKFKAFFDYATQVLNADFIATGHYAQRTFGEDPVHLCRAVDNSKDQSYFLHAIDGRVLNRVLFPVGSLLKTKVRKIAQDLSLATAGKKDSTGICFIGEKRFNEFLKHYLPSQAGDIVDEQGRVLGRHDGLMYATIGQRKGLHIGGVKNSTGEAWYVIDKDLKNNRLIVSQGHSSEALYKDGLIAVNETWLSGRPSLPMKCTCKIRYRGGDIPCTVTQVDDNRLKAEFEVKSGAVAPGQSVVFYQDEVCLGGAIIQQAL